MLYAATVNRLEPLCSVQMDAILMKDCLAGSGEAVDCNQKFRVIDLFKSKRDYDRLIYIFSTTLSSFTKQ